MGPTTIPGVSQPSQQPQAAAQGVDLISTLIQQAHEVDTRAAASAKQAIIPIAGGHIAPQQQKQFGNQNPRMFAQDTNPVVGKHQATMRGLRNAAAGVANLITQVDQHEAKKEQQNLSVNIERLMHATASMDQAQTVLKQDPNNADAKAQFEKAKASADEILSDKKNRSQIAKAYNINFTDPSKNNTPQHAALKQAQESFSEQFQKQLPTEMQPNQVAIAQATSDAAEAKATHSLIEKITPAIIRAQSAQNVADTAAKSRTDAAGVAASSRIEAANIGYHRGIDAAKIAGHFHLAAALATAKNRMDLLDKKYEHAQGKGLDKMSAREINAYIKDLETETTKLPQVISNLEELRKEKGAIKAGRVGTYDAAIHGAEEEMQRYTDDIQRARKALREKGGFDGGSTGSESQSDSTPTTTSSSTTNVRSTTIPSSNPDDFDEDTDDDD